MYVNLPISGIAIRKSMYFSIGGALRITVQITTEGSNPGLKNWPIQMRMSTMGYTAAGST